jgi:protein-L-isoaspartate(D-aspartate) O-methyltransferase
MERTRKELFPRRALARRIPALFVWIFLAGCALGVMVGIFLPQILPGFLPRGRIPSFLWGHDGTLSVHPGKEAETLPGTLLTVLSTAEPEPSASSNSSSNGASPTWDVAKELGTLPRDSEESFVAYMERTTGEESEYLKKRWELAQTFIKTHELQGNAIEAFLRTPRQDFVRAKNIPRAYEDIWMPVGYGATITNPAVVGMMTTTLDVKPGLKVLEIGTGSGYQSAILSHLTNSVYSIEIIEPLFRETDALYKSLQPRYPMYGNIHRKQGDGYYGWEKYAPFDRIIVTCAVDHLPPPLIQQLAPRGIMVVPLGPPARQYIMKVERSRDDKGNVTLKRTDVYNGLSVKFIPFLDEQGHSYSGQSP